MEIQELAPWAFWALVLLRRYLELDFKRFSQVAKHAVAT